MHLVLSEQQRLLRASVRRLAERAFSSQETRKQRATALGYSHDVWQELADAGWVGALVPQEYGGSSLDFLDFVVVLEELGRRVAPTPYLSHVLATLALSELGDEDQKTRFLPELCAGSKRATMALFDDPALLGPESVRLVAAVHTDGLVLSGNKKMVLDPEGADLVLIACRVTDGSGLALAIVDASSPGLTCTAFPTIDGTKRMGEVLCDNVAVRPESVMKLEAPGEFERLVDQGSLAMASEMLGAIERALELTVEHAKNRHQFGRPIGQFQAVKHPLADTYVELESLRSLVYSGAHELDERRPGASRAASLAKAYATEALLRIGTEAIQIHGAAGYTVENDIHLYYLRSKWARPVYGDAGAHYERALAYRQHAASASYADIDVELTDPEKTFREQVRDFIREYNPPLEKRDAQAKKRWLRAAREKRYVGFSWPERVGGGGGSVMEQFILKEEMLGAGALSLGTDYTGLGWVGPAIIQFGTSQQQDQLLPPILEGKSVWCTGYSEPGVGSDLASVQCRAVLDADGSHYRLNGQKTWISLAHIGTDICCLVRTNAAESKYEGLSILLVPLNLDGITVRPIKNFAGDHFADLYNEVFFDDVKVPVERRLGNEGDGWRIVCSALQNERSNIADVNRHDRYLTRLLELASNSMIAGGPALQSEVLRRKLSMFDARIEALRLNGLRALFEQRSGKGSESTASINKLHNCFLTVAMADTALEILADSSPYIGGSPAATDSGKWQVDALGWPTTVIGGGTPNIQRNIIAERMLGLPKD